MADKGLVEQLLRERGLSRKDAYMRKCPMTVKTKLDEDSDEWETAEFEVELPFSLADAVAFHGEAHVFKKFIDAQAVYEQGQKRSELRTKGGAKPRAKAKYLESLDL